MREQPKVGLNDSAHLKDLNHHLNVRIGELALSLKQVLIVGGLSIFGFFCFGYYKFGQFENQLEKQRKQPERLKDQINSIGRQMELIKHEIRNLKQKKAQERINNQNFKIVPYFLKACWRGIRSTGGNTWYHNKGPQFTGQSDPQTTYSAEFDKMSSEMTRLNSSSEQVKCVKASQSVLGNSCDWRTKKLIVTYQCRKISPDTFQTLIFKNGERQSSRQVQQGKSIFADCRDIAQAKN